MTDVVAVVDGVKVRVVWYVVVTVLVGDVVAEVV